MSIDVAIARAPSILAAATKEVVSTAKATPPTATMTQ